MTHLLERINDPITGILMALMLGGFAVGLGILIGAVVWIISEWRKP